MTEQATGRSKQNVLLPWLIVVSVIAVIALAMIFKRAGNEPTPATGQDKEAAPGDIAAARQHQAAGSSSAPVLPMSAEAARVQRQRITENRKLAQRQVDRTQEAFASRYGSERTDATWAGAKEAELARLSVSDQIAQLGVEAQNLAVDCKSTMCRITGDFPTITAGDDWFTLYMNNVGDKVPVASYKYVHNPDGSVTINVYAQGRK